MIDSFGGIKLIILLRSPSFIYPPPSIYRGGGSSSLAEFEEGRRAAF